jgi:aryl-alcohol dehydrogenase-like predicted oxidoreductase
MLQHLGLGTVQFGMHYGVSNRSGPPDETEIAAILARAAEAGAGYLDTAVAYPNSETLIGRHLAARSAFKIVTKTAPIVDAGLDRGHTTRILETLAESMDRLRTSHLHGLLVHQAADLRKPGWEHLVEALNEAKSRGWVGCIGASVYNEEQLELVESRFEPDIIQGPFNVLDTRLISSSCFARLKSRGTQMHARSVFLQGLLLMQPSTLPVYFEPVKATLVSLQASWAAKGVSPLAGCLGFVMGRPDIDVTIVGVNSVLELEDILSAATSRLPEQQTMFGSPQPIDTRYLDPSLWPSFVH